MTAYKRKSTKYPGVFYRFQLKLNGFDEERMYYIIYRKGGRGSKLIEEPVGRESEGMTASKANKIRAIRASGMEPSNTEKRKAEEAERNANRWTVNRIWESYQTAHPEHRGRSEDLARYRLHLSQRFGEKTPEEITTADVNQMKTNLLRAGRKPATVQRIIVLLRAVLNYGVENNLCAPLNPQKLVFKTIRVDNQKTEVLTDEQLARYLKALDEEKDQDAAGLIRLALVTGMRKGALLALRWDDCDMERGIITLRGESAKKGKTEYIPMNDAARKVLEGLTRTESPFVFPGKDGKQRNDYRRISRRVKQKAGLPADFRPLHGLRHNFASRLASSGQVDLYTLQKLLTHQSSAMTQRYAHLRDETLRRASCVANTILFPEKILQEKSDPTMESKEQ